MQYEEMERVVLAHEKGGYRSKSAMCLRVPYAMPGSELA